MTNPRHTYAVISGPRSNPQQRSTLFDKSRFREIPFKEYEEDPGDVDFLVFFPVSNHRSPDYDKFNPHSHLEWNIREYDLLRYDEKIFLAAGAEPAIDAGTEKSFEYGGKRFYVINAYNGLYWFDARQYISSFGIKEMNGFSDIPLEQVLDYKSKHTIILSGVKRDHIIHPISPNRELVSFRKELGIYGHSIGKCDIYGIGWPAGVLSGNTRSEKHWGIDKVEKIRPYLFNICFENTCIKHYVTEKIWHSIACYCLPIYYGGHPSSIYDIFPEDSFVDYSKFDDPTSLYEFTVNMSKDEWLRRMKILYDISTDLYTELGSKAAGRHLKEFLHDSLREKISDFIISTLCDKK